MPALDGTITFATSEYRPCLVKGQHALFHRWEDNSEIYAPSVMIGGHEDGKPQLNASGKPAPFPSMVVIYNGGSGKK